LDERDDGGDIQDALAELTGGRSVPRVFVEEAFIGGGDDTERLARSGELAKLVANV
jgi:glutaredoxin 3